MHTIKRLLEDHVVRSLEAFPVVYIAGPRQSGKTTLVQRIAKTRHKAQYITFDDIQVRSSAQNDPEAFLRSLKGPVVLDEIQMVPELFRPLKIIVDENRSLTNGGRGRFLLTGSASVMALPKLSDALVGRMVLHTLPPFSMQEIEEANSPTFADRVFSEDWSFTKKAAVSPIDAMLKASFPEVSSLHSAKLRHEWCNGYINTILQRDVRFLMEVEKIGILPDMLRLFAARTGSLLNETSISKDIGLNHVTVKRYRLLLENLFLTLTVPAWTNNLGKRLIKSPKIYLNDTNLLAYLINAKVEDFPQSDPIVYGHILENFVATELSKQLTFSSVQAKLYHYRTSSQQEIDFLLEGPMNKIVGIEIKARSQVTQKDFRHLETLKEDLKDRFERGVVVYQGDQVLPFGNKLWAVPISVLWGFKSCLSSIETNP